MCKYTYTSSSTQRSHTNLLSIGLKEGGASEAKTNKIREICSEL